MARIEGVDLPRNKRVEIGLTYLFGIGSTRVKEILNQTKVNPDTRIKDLSEAEVTAIREYISKNYKGSGYWYPYRNKPILAVRIKST